MISYWQDAPSWWAVAITVYGLLLLLPAWSDLFRSRVVPDLFTYPLAIVAAVLLWAGPGGLTNVLAGAATALAFYLVCASGNMAWGDFKLIVPVAAMTGGNFLIMIFVAMVATLPFQFKAFRKTRKEGGPRNLLSDEIPPFGPGTVAAAHLVLLAMGMPWWTAAAWLAGWAIMVGLGVYERNTTTLATPQAVRTWSSQNREGDLSEFGRIDWILRFALLNALIDDEHWDELHSVKPYETVQPLEGTSLLARWEGNRCHLALTSEGGKGRE